MDCTRSQTCNSSHLLLRSLSVSKIHYLCQSVNKQSLLGRSGELHQGCGWRIVDLRFVFVVATNIKKHIIIVPRSPQGYRFSVVAACPNSPKPWRSSAVLDSSIPYPNACREKFLSIHHLTLRSIRSVLRYLAIGIYSRLLSSKLPNIVLVLTQREQCQLRGAK